MPPPNESQKQFFENPQALRHVLRFLSDENQKGPLLAPKYLLPEEISETERAEREARRGGLTEDEEYEKVRRTEELKRLMSLPKEALTEAELKKKADIKKQARLRGREMMRRKLAKSDDSD